MKTIAYLGTLLSFGVLSMSSAHARTHIYDEAGRLIRIAYPQGQGIEYRYDANDNLTEILPLTLPPAPGGLEVQRDSDTTATLTWTDAADNEDGYVIMRRLATNHIWEEIATVGANTTSYTDDDVPTGQNVVYRIAAIGSEGMSAYSNESAAAGPGSEAFTISRFAVESEAALARRFKIELETLAGARYHIETAAALRTWTTTSFATNPVLPPLENTFDGNGGTVILFVDVLAAEEARYFRVIRE